MALLTAEDIDSVDDRKWEDVPVPEWGGTVRIAGMSGTERDAHEAKMVAVRNGGKDIELRLQNIRVRMVAKCLVDAKFQRLYSDTKVAKLGEKNAEVIVRLHAIAQRLSGMGKDAVEAGKESSSTDQSESSTSD